MTNIAIRVENLSKKYTIGLAHQKHDTLRDLLVDIIRTPFHKNSKAREEKSTLWALRGISFEVKRGEVVGIIGRNGAGKSTLLKILSRITEPTSGRAVINGRIASLLEVGTGFHPELTGRENIYLNGAILGMHRNEIDRKFDEIVAFSEIEKFLDTPVKRYSSGMFVRLAFAVAAHLDPEILLVDEVLAVGDVEFQNKCLGKMGNIAKEGRTVLFVSHNMPAVRQLCQKGIVINSGTVAKNDLIGPCIDYYLNPGKNESSEIISHAERLSDKVFVRNVSVNGQTQDNLSIPYTLDALEVKINFDVLDPDRIALEAAIVDSSGNCVAEFCLSNFMADNKKFPVGSGTIIDRIKLPLFSHGVFYLHIFLTTPGVAYLYKFPNAVKLNMESRPSALLGFTVDHQSGRGAILLEGETENYSA
jgi:lipopolysaccharide transport system ATP-binding protein